MNVNSADDYFFLEKKGRSASKDNYQHLISLEKKINHEHETKMIHQIALNKIT